MGNKADLTIQSDFQKLTFGGSGQRKLTNAAPSISGENFIAVYGNADSIISYDSAAHKNQGDASISSVSVPKHGVYTAIMTNITVTSGEVIAYIL